MEKELFLDSAKSSANLSASGKILIYITGGLAIGVSVICIPFVTPALRKICLPYVPATTKQIAGIKKALAGRTGTLLDVGSGDGRIVLATTKLGFKADGVELNPWLAYYSRLTALLTPRCHRAKFYRRDLWKFNLKPYNNIVIFGVEQMMEKFEKKILQEVDSGSVVVACRFPLPNVKPVNTIGHGIDTVWVYYIKR